MSSDFDPYVTWLAIPPDEQPPHYYRLLGIPLFTADEEVIENAANQRIAYLRAISADDRVPLAQKLLSDVALARACLLHPNSKAEYDTNLRRVLLPIAPDVPAAPTQHGSATNIDVAPRSSPQRKRMASGIVNLIGHILAPIVGLSCGYLLLNQISPRYDFLGIFQQSTRASTTMAQKAKVTEAPQVKSQLPAASEIRPTLESRRPTATAVPAAKVADEDPAFSKPREPGADATATPAAQPATAELERTTKLTTILSEEATAKTRADFKRLAVALIELLQTAQGAERTRLLEAHQERLLLWARKSQDEEFVRNVTRIILGQLASIDDKPIERPRQEIEKVAPQTAPPPVLRNTLGMELVLIPAGKFSMGAVADDPDAAANEKPAHPQSLGQAYYLGKYEVTVGQFRRFVAATGHKTQAEIDPARKGGTKAGCGQNQERFDTNLRWHNPGFPQTDEHPVCVVSWEDAISFCNWLSTTEQVEYRLPSEIEWEYACRANQGGNRYCAADMLAQYEWYQPGAGCSTHPVGEKMANPWGLHDLHGNVREWCVDAYDASLYTRRSKDPDAKVQADTRIRSVRGGSFADESTVLRTSVRSPMARLSRASNIGFRVWRSAPTTDAKPSPANSGLGTHQRIVSARTSMHIGTKLLPAAANTGISIRKGQQVAIRAGGTWKIGTYQYHVVGTELLTFAFGNPGQPPMLIKSGLKESIFVAEQDGILFLGINDLHVHDNHGELAVEVSVRAQ